MDKTIIILIILGVVLITFIALLINSYNKFIKMNNKVRESISSVDIHLKKRFDLIPNLVAVVKGYAKHEKSTIEEIARLRNVAEQTEGCIEKIELANQTLPLMQKLFAITESYPELKADEQYKTLQNALIECEEELVAVRRFYISNITNYNNMVQTFPSNIVAYMFKFKRYTVFEIAVDEKIAPTYSL
ncbi:MAG: LemA family protein [Clostridia bacterium]